MQANYVQRIRLSFSKGGPTRFIGHLDLARTLERSINRARIPIAYSQGFNRRPRMQLAAALPLGYTSAHELVDVWLTETLEPEDLRRRLMERMAPGIEIYQANDVPTSEPSLQTRTVESSYEVTLLDQVDVDSLQAKIEGLLASASHIRERGHGRKRKEYDLRPQIIDLTLVSDDVSTRILMRLYLMEGNTGRPDEVLLALGLDPLAARVHRTHIVLSGMVTPEGI